MSTTRKAATSNAELQKDIENRISKFVADSEHKGHATLNKKLPNRCRLNLYIKEIMGTTYVGVQIFHNPGKDVQMYHSAYPADKNGIREAAEGAAKVVTDYGSDSEKAELIRHVKTR